jgi:thiamine biosynthesis protein ThiS
MSIIEPRLPDTLKTGMIDIVVNGEPMMVPAGSHLASLVDRIGLPQDRVAVELNRRIVRRGSWEETALEAGASVEIVHFVGGG